MSGGVRVYPARFKGEFAGYPHWPRCREICPEIGDVALFVRENGEHDVVVRCACGNYNTLPIAGTERPQWAFTSREPVNLEPSILTRHDPRADLVCHYYVHGGRLEMLPDTTAPLP